jgi:hypothetical protein
VIREQVIASLREFAASLGATADGSEWHLFGSVVQNIPAAADIDLMILCKSANQADLLRRTIDPDALALPLHIALLTFDEASEIDAVRVQHSSVIFP